MIRSCRDASLRGDSVRGPRGGRRAARGHVEAAREARDPRSLLEVPPAARGPPCRSPGHRKELRGSRSARPERRLGDAPEGVLEDEADEPRGGAPYDPRGIPRLRADRGRERPGFDENPTEDRRIPPWARD